MDIDVVLETLAVEPRAAVEVAEVALMLARDEFPQLDVEAHLSEITAMAHEARRYVRGDLTARVQGLCRYLFHDLGFHGNQRDYYDPANSYLNLVLERRTGIPISLSALTMAVGQRAGLEMWGVGLPGHFVVKAVEGTREIVIDPFHGGRVLSGQDCQILVEQVTGQAITAAELSLEALPPGLIVQRMLNNLKGIYLSREDFGRAVRIMERLRQILPDHVSQRRDLGVGYLRLGQPGKAIDHLQAYLTAFPEAADVEPVKQVLRQAQKAVAEWN